MGSRIIRKCKCGCGEDVVSASLRGGQRRLYVNDMHSRRDISKYYPKQADTPKAVANRARRYEILGRICRYCKVEDHERAFENKTTCVTCQKGIYRHKCRRCGGPSYALGCPDCNLPPEGFEVVIVIDQGSDREKKLWRRVDSAGAFMLSDTRYAGLSKPFVVQLPTPGFLRARRFDG